MLLLEDSDSHRIKFDTIIEAKDYIEARHAKEGGFDWIREIKDDKGSHYGCSWKLGIEKI